MVIGNRNVRRPQDSSLPRSDNPVDSLGYFPKRTTAKRKLELSTTPTRNPKFETQNRKLYSFAT